MKKIIKYLLVFVLLCCSCCILFACDDAKTEHVHKIVVDEAIESTCITHGKTKGYHCSECGEIIVKQEELPFGDHKNIITDKGAKSTCLTHGLSEGSHCEDCGAIIVKQEELPLGNHNYLVKEVLIENINDISKCGKFECDCCHAQVYKEITTEDLGMPIISFTGNIDEISKENKVNIQVKYSSEEKNFTCDATLKLQGSSSVRRNYPKQNYSIQFFESGTDLTKKYKVEMAEDWGKQSKYCLKANYVDFSAGRNVLTAKLYGQIVHSRNIEDEYSNLINGGAIDGFPVAIYLNGEYHGLYTLNIPKDKWMFGMKDGEEYRQAIIMPDAYNQISELKKHLTEASFTNGNYIDMEFCSTEETESGLGWMVDSFNNMMDFVINNDGKDFVDGISEFINVERSIDAMLFTWFSNATDNFSHNILWNTFDGKVWSCSMYDLDATWGLDWSGNNIESATNMNMHMVDGSSYTYNNKSETTNLLWSKLFTNCFDVIKARYYELRENVLVYDNIKNTFESFFDLIPDCMYEAEMQKFPNVPNQDANNLSQMLEYARIRLETFDEYFENH